MEIKKINGRYYVNNQDLQEILSNRKHIINYIEKEIDVLNNLKDSTKSIDLERKTRYKTLKEIQRELKLRK